MSFGDSSIKIAIYNTKNEYESFFKQFDELKKWLEGFEAAGKKVPYTWSLDKMREQIAARLLEAEREIAEQKKKAAK